MINLNCICGPICVLTAPSPLSLPLLPLPASELRFLLYLS